MAYESIKVETRGSVGLVTLEPPCKRSMRSIPR